MQPNGAKTELFIFLLSEAEGLTSVWKYFKKKSHCKEFRNNSVERRHFVFKIKMFLKKWCHSHPAPSPIQETEVHEHS